MPYSIESSSSCPLDKPFAMILNSTGKIVMCHATRAEAQNHIEAIYASEHGKLEKDQPSSSAVHVDTIMKPKKRKPVYDPSVLIKGDFVGHPFRGNQWGDASGISTQTATMSAPDRTSSNPRNVGGQPMIRHSAGHYESATGLQFIQGAPPTNHWAVYRSEDDHEPLYESARGSLQLAMKDFDDFRDANTQKALGDVRDADLMLLHTEREVAMVEDTSNRYGTGTRFENRVVLGGVPTTLGTKTNKIIHSSRQAAEKAQKKVTAEMEQILGDPTLEVKALEDNLWEYTYNYKIGDKTVRATSRARFHKPSPETQPTLSWTNNLGETLDYFAEIDARRKQREASQDVTKFETSAWQRDAGKNPKGGLNAAGRAAYNRETGGNLKPPVKSGDNPRRASFLARMGNNAGPERDEKGEPTRLLLSLQAWGADSKADARAKAKAISARNANNVDKFAFGFLKGDYVGHPFRGNQWADSSGISVGGAGSSADQDRQAFEMRQAGQTWDAIAQSLGYANGGAVRRLAVRHEERLRADNVTPPVPPLVAKPVVEPTAAVARGGFVNGLLAPTADPVVAAREGRPLAGWSRAPLEVQALIDKRDALVDERTKMIPEAKKIRDEYLKGLTPEQAAEDENQSLARQKDGRSLLLFASKINSDFAARLKTTDYPDELGFYQLQKPLLDAALIAAGFRYRTEAEMVQLESDIKGRYTHEYGSPEYLAREARVRADPSDLEFDTFSRGRSVEGRTGRLEVSTERIYVSELSVRARMGASSEDKISDQLLGRLTFGPLLARGLTIQQIGEQYLAAKSVANDWLETPAIRATFNDQTVAQMNAEIEKALPILENAVKNAQVSVTVPPRILSSILKDGKFETQFVSGKSGGYNLPQARQAEEASRFGYPADLNPELRPVYGMVETDGIKLPNDRGNLQYGSALVILKPEVRERTTFSRGDSLSLHSPSTPLTYPRAQPLAISRNMSDGANFKLNYAEAQIHGGVRASDIARVVFQVGAMGYGNEEAADPKLASPPSGALLKALDKAGIPYQIVKFTSEIDQKVLKFNPYALFKGDFVGHPFRGNQWTDSSGASQGGASGASDGDLFDLRGVATVEEARRTGRPLAMLRPETYSPKVRKLVDANTQASDLLGQIITEAKANGDVTAASNDPRWAALETILVLTAVEASRQIALEYALALGFETVPEPPTSRYGYVVSEEFAYEDQSRNEDGRLIRSEETIDANFAVNSTRVMAALALPTVILEKSDDGKVTVRFAKYEGKAAGVSRGGYEYGDNVDVATLLGAKFVRATDDTSGLDSDTSAFALARTEQGGDLGRELVRRAAQELGITLPAFRPPVHVTAAPLAEKLRAQGESDVSDKIGTMLAHVEDVSRGFAMFKTAISTDTAGRRTDDDNMKPAMLAEQAVNLPSDTKVSVTVPANRVAAILKDGRLKTQFETGTSKGLNLPQVRESAEALEFGLPQGTNPATRPIYGMMESGGMTLPSSLRGNEQYGTVTLVLKNDVRNRTTFTEGDSLNRQGDPVPANDASKSLSARNPDSRENFDRRTAQRSRGGSRADGYYEAQIYGGVKTSDIERVVIDTSTYKDYGQREVQPSAALLKALDKAGIPYEILQGKPPDATKSAFAPTVLIKGDFVGHPFRGNQWSDSSGVSQGGSSSNANPSDQTLRTIAEDINSKLDVLISDGARFIEHSKGLDFVNRQIYEQQLPMVSSVTPQARLIADGVALTEEAINDEDANIVVIENKQGTISGAISMTPKPYTPAQVSSRFFDTVDKESSWVEMRSAGSTMKVDGIGSGLFAAAIIKASESGSGLFLVPLDENAKRFWASKGFRVMEQEKTLGRTATTFQYLDAASVQVIADNLEDIGL